MDEKNDKYFMQKALEQAKIAFDKDEVPIGAVVVCNGQIIARACNLTETLNDVTAHAEMQAITSAANYLGGKYLTDCTLYVTVEPCPMCAGALAWAQISRIVYGAVDEKRGSHHFSGIFHPKTVVQGGVLEEECAALMKEFFAKKR
jgi:tRNA(adenine34) deaminase